MKKFNLSKWDNISQLSNLLFFAQCVDFLLNFNTTDNFRNKVSNSFTLAMEFYDFTDGVMSGVLKKSSGHFIVEELEYKINSDPVIKYLNTNAFVRILNKIKGTKNITQLQTHSQSLVSLFSENYWAGTKSLLEKTVRETKSKNTIKTITEIFITQLIQNGYSAEFIYMNNLYFFFAGNYQPRRIFELKQIKDYINRFDLEKKKWTVYIPFECKSFTYYEELEQLGIKHERLEDIDCLQSTKRKFTEKQDFFLTDNIRANDNHSATENYYSFLNTTLSVFRTYDHSIDFKLSRKGIVYDPNEERYAYINREFNPMRLGLKKTEIRRGEYTRSINVILSCNDKVKRKLVSIINSHSNSVDFIDDNSKFLTLWSALESILPSFYSSKTNIENYIEVLIASELLSYNNNVFLFIQSTFERLQINPADEIINKVMGSNYRERLVNLIVNKNVSEERKKLYLSLKDYPILVHILNLTHNRYNKVERILKTLQEHRRNIAWHIQRIYQTRNRIVHNSESVGYVNQLTTSLHSYFDNYLECFISILNKGNPEISTVSSIAMSIINEYECFVEKLKTNKDIYIDLDNYKNYIFNKENV